MPIREIIVFGLGVLSVLFVTNPLHFREAIQRTELQIMREVGPTNNWGNPSIFVRHRSHGIHIHVSTAHVNHRPAASTN